MEVKVTAISSFKRVRNLPNERVKVQMISSLQKPRNLSEEEVKVTAISSFKTNRIITKERAKMLVFPTCTEIVYLIHFVIILLILLCWTRNPYFHYSSIVYLIDAFLFIKSWFYVSGH